MNELEEILARVGAELDTAMPEIEIPAVEAEGTSEDEQVRITVANGQVTDVSIDPRSLRKSSAELADDIKAATNAALQAHAQALMAAMQEQSTDPATLRTDLDGVRDQAVKSLSEYLDTMTAMMEAAAAKQG